MSDDQLLERITILDEDDGPSPEDLRACLRFASRALANTSPEESTTARHGTNALLDTIAASITVGGVRKLPLCPMCRDNRASDPWTARASGGGQGSSCKHG